METKKPTIEETVDQLKKAYPDAEVTIIDGEIHIVTGGDN